MSTASNSSTALAPRTAFFHLSSRRAAGRLSTASNLSVGRAKHNLYYNASAIVTESQFEALVTKTMFAVLMKTPLAQLEAIIERRRREEL